MRRVTEGYPYPASSRDHSEEPYMQQLAYDMACDAWARKLPENTLREFTMEYLRGSDAQEAVDAHAEYRRREALGKLSHQRSADDILNSRKSRSRNRSRK